MYDSGKIIVGLIIFIGLFTYPVWYNFATGKAAYKPDPVLPNLEGQKECVQETNYMKDFHMDLLNSWRDEVVRKGNRNFITASGVKYEMSLSGTCMNCHSNKKEFCDQCHNYLGVTPYCWDCHIEPPETETIQ